MWRDIGFFCAGVAMTSAFFAITFRRLTQDFRRLGDEAQRRVKEMDEIKKRNSG